MTQQKSLPVKKIVMLLAAVAISGGSLWYACYPLINDAEAWGQFVNAFKIADYRSLPIIWLILFLFYILKAWRWRLMLAPIGNYRAVKDLLPPIMIGFSFNNLLPFRMGEVARCFVFSKQQKLPFSVAVSSVVLERFFDLIGVLFFLGVGLLFMEDVGPEIKNTAIVGAVIAVVGVLGGVAYVLWTKPVLNLFEKIFKSIPLIPHAFTDKVCSILEAGAKGLSAIRNVRLLVAMLVLSIIKWGLNGFLVWISVWSFGLTISPAVAMVLLGVIAFGVAVPAVPGYFGVMQLCFTLVLGLFFAGPENRAAILAASIYFQMTQWIPVTIIGFVYFVFTGIKLSDVGEKQEEREVVDGPVTELPSVPL